MGSVAQFLDDMHDDRYAGRLGHRVVAGEQPGSEAAQARPVTGRKLPDRSPAASRHQEEHAGGAARCRSIPTQEAVGGEFLPAAAWAGSPYERICTSPGQFFSGLEKSATPFPR